MIQQKKMETFHCRVYTESKGFDGEHPRYIHTLFEDAEYVNFKEPFQKVIKYFQEKQGDFKAKYITQLLSHNSSKYTNSGYNKTINWNTTFYHIKFEFTNMSRVKYEELEQMLTNYHWQSTPSLEELLVKFMQDNPGVHFPRNIRIAAGVEQPTIYDQAPFLKDVFGI
jgi:hypothetical protein